MRGLQGALLTLAITTVGFPQFALAEGPVRNPGKWEVKTVSTNNMVPKEIVKTATECVKENKNPLDAIVEAGKCTVTNQETKGNTVTWDMECRGQVNGAGKGKGSFTATGDSGEGTIDITMNVADKTFIAKNVWTGKRVGNCD
jgi:hypothetical protein